MLSAKWLRGTVRLCVCGRCRFDSRVGFFSPYTIALGMTRGNSLTLLWQVRVVCSHNGLGSEHYLPKKAQVRCAFGWICVFLTKSLCPVEVAEVFFSFCLSFLCPFKRMCIGHVTLAVRPPVLSIDVCQNATNRHSNKILTGNTM